MNRFKFIHTNGDFEVTMEFEADQLGDVVAMVKAFLKGCSFSSKSVDEYIPED